MAQVTDAYTCLGTGSPEFLQKLTIAARYVLAALDQEAQLLQLLASEARHGPRILTEAVVQVVNLTYREFAEWIIDRSGSVVSVTLTPAAAPDGDTAECSTQRD